MAMLSWITGSRSVEARDEGEGEGIENTFMEAPDTPAPVFAVRAFKHALFGTPLPEVRNIDIRPFKSGKESEVVKAVLDGKGTMTLAKPEDNSRSTSPTKLGILHTPGTMRRKKDVTFGADVVDNEGKRVSRSGIPNSCPGKFPSPWTPKAVDLFIEESKSNSKIPRTNSEAQATGRMSEKDKSKPKPRAKDDVDITIDIMEPRSESGRYWKEQYTSYSRKTEQEVKKLIAKQKLAKDYARKKDDEASDALTQLELEQKRRQSREKALENEIRDLRERLRKAMGENAQSMTEVAILRQQTEVACSTPLGRKSNVEEAPIAMQNERSTLTSRTDLPAHSRAIKCVNTDSKISESLLAIPTTTSPTMPDFLWEDAALPVDQKRSRPFTVPSPNSYSIQARGEKVRSIYIGSLPRKSTQRERRESQASRKQEKIESNITENKPTTQSSAQRRPTRRVRRTLCERNPNIESTTKPSEVENCQSETNEDDQKQFQPFDPSTFLDSFDPATPIEALSIQAERPITSEPSAPKSGCKPTVQKPPIHSSKMSQHPTAQLLDMPAERMATMKARVEEKKAERRRAKENSRRA